jgi:hypothetical protein
MKLTELLEGRDLTNRVTVPVLVNTDAARRIIDAEKQVGTAKRRVDSAEDQEKGRLSQPSTLEAKGALEAAETELRDAREEAERHLYDFVLQSVGAAEWQELVSLHPPTEEQRERLGKELDYDPDTFPLAAIAVCLADPEVTSVDEVKQLRAKLPQAVWQQLWDGCLRANLGVNKVPPSLTGSHATSGSGLKSGQPSS